MSTIHFFDFNNTRLQHQATAKLCEQFSEPMLVEPIPVSWSRSFQEVVDEIQSWKS